MPYRIQSGHPKCSGYAVVNKQTGRLMGCHKTRDDALKQMAALYANVPDAGRDDNIGEDSMTNIEDDQRDEQRDVWTGPNMFMRAFPLEDIRILTRAQGSEFADGRTVEAYAAVFDRPAEIQDNEGHYLEAIDRAAFNRVIEHSRPQGSRSTWRTSVFYNHGMTLYGTPSDRFSVPLGSPVEIRAEERGLLTVTRYNEGPLADEILEAIRSGDITGHSFSGRKVRSDPMRPPSRIGYRAGSDGRLPTVRRLELGLKEYGPTPFPAYIDTAVVGVRSLLAGLPGLLSITRSDESDPVDIDTSTAQVDPVPDDSPADGHSSRDSLLRRIAAARTTRPGLTSLVDEGGVP